ncbi:MAG: TIM barrel protein [Chloroflexi bacterium]|nr:TIM barrel protein [Chloroflexota bacterium]
MSKLLFGTAGIPLSTPNDNSELLTVAGIHRVRALNLAAMEIEFVRQVYITAKTAPLVLKAAQHSGIALSAHAPYYINLNAAEQDKRNKSRAYIYNAAKAVYACGGTDVVFHAGYYMDSDPQDVYKIMRDEIYHVTQKLLAEDIRVCLRPEVSGRPSAFGSLEEVIKLSSELKGVLPCIDFSHAYARSQGRTNSYEAFCSILQNIKDELGEEALTQNLHAHISGIAYTASGEKNHLLFAESQFNMGDMVRALKDMHAGGRVICESPDIEGDALKLQQAYQLL